MACQQNKVETVKTMGLLQQLSMPCQHWEEIPVNLIKGIPKLEGKNVIRVVVDKLTNYAHFCALFHPFNASTVTATFMDTDHKLHGNLNIIVSDRDPIFTIKFWI